MQEDTIRIRCRSRNEAIIVIPSRNKLFWWFDRLFPELNLRLPQKIAEYFRQTVTLQSTF